MYTSSQGYNCIYTGVYRDAFWESGCTSKGSSHFHQSKNCLWMVQGYVSVHFIQAQIIIDCGNKSMFTWWIWVFPEEALEWRNFGVLAVLKVRKCYWKVRNSPTALSQAFQHVFECGHVHITSNTS